jgi:hypothetical protein
MGRALKFCSPLPKTIGRCICQLSFSLTQERADRALCQWLISDYKGETYNACENFSRRSYCQNRQR